MNLVSGVDSEKDGTPIKNRDEFINLLLLFYLSCPL